MKLQVRYKKKAAKHRSQPSECSAKKSDKGKLETLLLTAATLNENKPVSPQA
jgi:hypothetical protein